MSKSTRLNTKIAVVLYILIDVICVGGGMGVPIFCILLGFPVGWYLAKKTYISTDHSSLVFSKILKLSLLTTSFTFLLMVLVWGIWGRAISMLLDPSSDFQNFGHPFILYDPKASFIGWIILMIFISPFLQLLTTIFASFITVIRISKLEVIKEPYNQ